MSDNNYSIPYALFNSKIKFNPYQYLPYYKFYYSKKLGNKENIIKRENDDKNNLIIGQNLLIADEVGLGKTIEAGIIISEFLQRKKDANILIIVPAGLCKQWQMELNNFFMIQFADFYECKGKENILPNYKGLKLWIYPHSQVQEDKLNNYLGERLWDIVIVDEIHNFRNEESKGYEALKNVKAINKIFMSATAIFNRNKDLENIEEILNKFIDLPIGDYDTCASYKADAYCLDYITQIKTKHVELNQKEIEFYEKLNNLELNPRVKAKYKHIACSSFHTVIDTLMESDKNKIIRFLKDDYIDCEAAKRIRKYLKSEDYEDKIKNDKDISNDIKEKLEYIIRENERLQELGNYYKDDFENGNDEKYEQLKTIIGVKENKDIDERYKESKEEIKDKEGSPHFIIFSCYIETCKYIENRLKSDGVQNVWKATGENDRNEINKAIDEFKRFCTNIKNEKSTAVLICSDVCREGKNFQFCNKLINYDLPYSPSVLQQRIGRIDRMGQKNTPEVYNIIRIGNEQLECYDEHLYMEILFEKLAIINKNNKICSLNITDRTETELKDKLYTHWIREKIKKVKEREEEKTGQKSDEDIKKEICEKKFYEIYKIQFYNEKNNSGITEEDFLRGILNEDKYIELREILKEKINPQDKICEKVTMKQYIGAVYNLIKEKSNKEELSDDDYFLKKILFGENNQSEEIKVTRSDNYKNIFKIVTEKFFGQIYKSNSDELEDLEAEFFDTTKKYLKSRFIHSSIKENEECGGYTLKLAEDDKKEKPEDGNHKSKISKSEIVQSIELIEQQYPITHLLKSIFIDYRSYLDDEDGQIKKYIKNNITFAYFDVLYDRNITETEDNRWNLGTNYNDNFVGLDAMSHLLK